MKKFFQYSIAPLLLCSTLAFAGDNVTDTNVYKAGTGENATLRTTESAGVHTPHVIVDSAPAGGGAATIADGADVTQGAKADASASSDTGTFSLIALFKRSLQTLTSIASSVATTATNTTGSATAANQTTANSSLSTIATNTSGAVPAGGNFIGNTGPKIILVTSSFTRPADTNAYTAGDLIANSTTAGSAVPLSWTVARASGTSFSVLRARVKKSSNVTANAAVTLWLYGSDPSLSSGILNGDNGALSTNVSSFIGTVVISSTSGFRDGSAITSSLGSSPLNSILPTGTTLYGLLAANGAYNPASGEVFTVELEVQQN